MSSQKLIQKVIKFAHSVRQATRSVFRHRSSAAVGVVNAPGAALAHTVSLTYLSTQNTVALHPEPRVVEDCTTNTVSLSSSPLVATQLLPFENPIFLSEVNEDDWVDLYELFSSYDIPSEDYTPLPLASNDHASSSSLRRRLRVARQQVLSCSGESEVVAPAPLNNPTPLRLPTPQPIPDLATCSPLSSLDVPLSVSFEEETNRLFREEDDPCDEEDTEEFLLEYCGPDLSTCEIRYDYAPLRQTPTPQPVPEVVASSPTVALGVPLPVFAEENKMLEELFPEKKESEKGEDIEILWLELFGPNSDEETQIVRHCAPSNPVLSISTYLYFRVVFFYRDKAAFFMITLV